MRVLQALQGFRDLGLQGCEALGFQGQGLRVFGFEGLGALRASAGFGL